MSNDYLDCATYDELFDMTVRMADELQDYINAAEDAGSEVPSTQELMDEWDALYKRTPLYRATRPENSEQPEVAHER